MEKEETQITKIKNEIEIETISSKDCFEDGLDINLNLDIKSENILNDKQENKIKKD